MGDRRRKMWGWGYEDEALSQQQASEAAAGVVAHLGFGSTEIEAPSQPRLPAPRIEPPAALREFAGAGEHARAFHALGSSYMDVVRGLRGQFDHAPDFVLRPRNEREIELTLEWCAAERVAAIPFGGGSSVVGGVEPRVPAGYNGAVTLDLGLLDRVLEIDSVSRSARIQAGALGPQLEAQLAEHDLTLRHFPQSFQFSSLGGWIATRAGGHFASLWTHIDDLIESIRAITPGAGVWQSRRLPGSGAGPSPDRMLLGSEGTLGVITEAWVRVQPKPAFRDAVAVRFPVFERGAEALREISQAGLHPSNCRLVDASEAELTGAGDGEQALLVLGFESVDHAVAGRVERALELCAAHGGSWKRSTGGGGAVGAWREAFLRAPYMRDLFAQMGVVAETCETAITWERFAALRESVFAAAREAAGPQARVSVRITHVYPNGPAPYFTLLAPARRGEEIEQWMKIKRAVSDALLAVGGTITHHHAVGRDHRPWYDEQRPEPFAAALRAAKSALDPAGVLNPGVLV